MREFKFRAWDKVRKQFLSYGQVLISIEPGSTPTDGHLYLDLIDKPDVYKDRFVIMQYTGLKDCEGKEIYEGDIVLSDHLDYAGQIPTIVEWQEYCFVINYKVPHDEYTPHCLSEYICETNKLKVIGNIYENAGIIVNLPEKDCK